MQELLYVDEDIHADMLEVMRYLYANNLQLDSLVSQEEMNPVLAQWGNVFRPSGDDFDYTTLDP